MNTKARIIFILLFFTTVNSQAASEFNYSDNQNTLYMFFPKEKASRDGYRILPQDWIELSSTKKKIFVKEAIEEIKSKENCVVSGAIDIDDLLSGFDKAMQIFRAGGAKTSIIAVLYRMLGYGGALEKCGGHNSEVKEKIRKDDSIPSNNIELAKTYTGYTDFYEKDRIWFMGKNPPGLGEIIKNLIYSGYTVYPSGTVLLSTNYPFNFDYRIETIKEINSFLNDDGLMAHYYEVTFVPINRNY